MSGPVSDPSDMRLEVAWNWFFELPPEALWPCVSDTDRFNQDAGLPPLIRLATPHKTMPKSSKSDNRATGVSPHPSPGGTWMAAALGPWLLRWREDPFAWVQGQGFEVMRHYLNGPLRSMRVSLALAAEADGTRLHYRIDMHPRWGFWVPVLRVILGRILRPRFDRAFHLAAQRARKVPAPAEGSATSWARGGRERLRQRLKTLREAGIDAETVERLGLFLAEAPDDDVARIRPYVHAGSWFGDRVVGAAAPGALRRQAIVLGLQAARAGLLHMRWEPICPYCRGAKGATEALDGLRSTVHCDACRIDFSTDLDRSVEVTFRIHPALRPVERGLFCAGSPARTPHVVAQGKVAPKASRRVDLDLEPGRYRLRSPEVKGGHYLRIEDMPSPHAPPHPAEVALGPQGWDRRETQLRAGDGMRWLNARDESAWFILERLADSDDAAMAADVLCLQAFQDLFGTETLRAGEEIAVGRLAFLFTDLKGSTRLYREVGDAKAFTLVMEHFGLLQKAIADAGGTVVKTIGDAVMAAFAEPEAAFAAALAGHHALAAAGIDLVLKAGIHCGPCIAVTQNERLDYFGSTLNMAARLLGHCQGGDIVLSQAAAEDPGLRGRLDDAATEALVVALRGFEGETHRLVRMAIASVPEGKSMLGACPTPKKANVDTSSSPTSPS